MKEQLHGVAIAYATNTRAVHPTELAQTESELQNELSNYFALLHKGNNIPQTKESYEVAKRTFALMSRQLLLLFVPELGPVLHDPTMTSAVIEDLPDQLYDIKRPRKALYEAIETIIDDPMNRNTTNVSRRELMQSLFRRHDFRWSNEDVTYEQHMRMLAARVSEKLVNIVFDVALQKARTTFFWLSSNTNSLASKAVELILHNTYVILMYTALHVMVDPYNVLTKLFDRVEWGQFGNGPEGWVLEESDDDTNDGYTTPPPLRASRTPPQTVRNRPASRGARNVSDRIRRAINFGEE